MCYFLISIKFCFTRTSMLLEYFLRHTDWGFGLVSYYILGRSLIDLYGLTVCYDKICRLDCLRFLIFLIKRNGKKILRLFLVACLMINIITDPSVESIKISTAQIYIFCFSHFHHLFTLNDNTILIISNNVAYKG